MIITEIPSILPEEFSMDTHERSPGLHLSDILNSMMAATGKNTDIGWDDAATFAAGFFWERVLRYVLLQARYEQKHLTPCGELEMDGVFITPDVMDVKDWVHEENKLTWKSSNNDPHSYYRYWWQVKAGCRVLETTKARLRVYHVNGDYRGSGPQWKNWEAEFTEQEIEENWSMVLNHARNEGML